MFTATAVGSNAHAVFIPDAAYKQAAQTSSKHRSIQQLKRTDREDERYIRMRYKVSNLWVGFEGTAYHKIRKAIRKRWTESGPLDKEFLEKAIDLLIEFQTRPMSSMKDSLKWLEHLKNSGIDSKRYLTWVDEQYELLAREKRNGFDNITLQRFTDSLAMADWKDANDDSAIFNAYLLNTEVGLRPEIYLGSLGKSHLAVRVNGECLRPRKTDSHTAGSYGVTAINPDILLDMRYVPLEPGSSKQTLLFIPIGNVFHTPLAYHNSPDISLEEWDWQDTGIVLVLGICRDKGTLDRIYMVKDLQPPKRNVDEDDKTLWEHLEINSFTLAEVKHEANTHPMSYGITVEKRVPELKRLSVFKLEIVQTGEKWNWSEGVPPVGLYPIDQGTEGA